MRAALAARRKRVRAALAARRKKGAGCTCSPPENNDYATRKVIANTVDAGAAGGPCDLRFRAGTSERAAQCGARPIDEAAPAAIPAASRAPGPAPKASRRADKLRQQAPAKAGQRPKRRPQRKGLLATRKTWRESRVRKSANAPAEKPAETGRRKSFRDAA